MAIRSHNEGQQLELPILHGLDRGGALLGDRLVARGEPARAHAAEHLHARNDGGLPPAGALQGCFNELTGRAPLAWPGSSLGYLLTSRWICTRSPGSYNLATASLAEQELSPQVLWLKFKSDGKVRDLCC